MTGKLIWQLLRKDLKQYQRLYPGKFFDTCFLLLTNVLVFGYFMPMLGLPGSYGTFILIGAIASFGLFDIVSQVGEFIFDIEGDKKITFTLALPIPFWAVFIQLVLKWSLYILTLCTPLFLIGKLFLWDRFSLAEINYLKLLLIFPTSSLFFGFFSLWITSMLKRINSIGSLFMRVINPLFMFGGYFFTWESSFELSKTIGYVLLFNPMIYVMEGMRAACLGQQGYLPFWACFCALWIFNLFLGTWAIGKLKKRLDCV